MNITFPTVQGSNLEGRKFTLPADLNGQLNVVLIAFQQWQQMQVDGWVPFLKELQAGFPSVRAYELPTLWQMDWLRRTMLNNGMRMGIPDLHTRETTITLYLDREAFLRALALPNMDSIFVLLIDKAGHIYWQTAGAFSAEKGQSLREAAERHHLI